MMDSRYDVLLDAGRRKITAETGLPVVVVVIDELAYFSSTVGDTKQQKEFVASTARSAARSDRAPPERTRRSAGPALDQGRKLLTGVDVLALSGPG